MEHAMLTAKNLAIGYPTQTLAENIGLELHAGKLTALCGANGIGKSTLLRTLTGLHQPISGSIHIKGKLLKSFTAKERARHISLVLTEKPSAGLTVEELISIGRQPYTNWLGTLAESDKSAVQNAMQLTAIDHLKNRFCNELSDGQLQMVMIARALAQDTPIITLDEPTTHLDLPNKFALLDLLRKLAHDQNKCIVFSTHDIEPALEFCDELILMSDRKAVQDSTGNLLKNDTLDNLFADRGVRFDATNVKFVFKDGKR